MYQPLGFIVFVSAVRALVEDVAKHRNDNKRNSYAYDVLDGDAWKPVRSGDLEVGMIVKVKQNEMVPTGTTSHVCMFVLGEWRARGKASPQVPRPCPFFAFLDRLLVLMHQLLFFAPGGG